MCHVRAHGVVRTLFCCCCFFASGTIIIKTHRTIHQQHYITPIMIERKRGEKETETFRKSTVAPCTVWIESVHGHYAFGSKRSHGIYWILNTFQYDSSRRLFVQPIPLPSPKSKTKKREKKKHQQHQRQMILWMNEWMYRIPITYWLTVGWLGPKRNETEEDRRIVWEKRPKWNNQNNILLFGFVHLFGVHTLCALINLKQLFWTILQLIL